MPPKKAGKKSKKQLEEEKRKLIDFDLFRFKTEIGV